MAVRHREINHLTVVLPLVLSIAGFVLAMVALFAGTGSQQQALEDYHLIAINMSNFGHDLVPTATSDSSPEATETDDGGFWDSVEDKWDEATDKIGDELNDIANDIADQLAQELGISQWYSLHIMTACEGDFAPNATNPNAWYNTTNCTAQEPGVNFNLTEVIAHEIDAGPLELNTADIPFPEEVQDAIDYLNGFLLAVFVLYVLGAGFSGLSFLFCIIILTLRKPVGVLGILVNTVNAGLAVLALAIGSAIATAISKKGVAEINDKGEGFGISAVEGRKFMIISWVAFAVMFVTLLFWCLSCCFPRNRAGTAYQEKTFKGTSSRRPGFIGKLFGGRRH